MDLRRNDTLCETFAEDMGKLGEKILLKRNEFVTGSTDMGNISYTVPSFHGNFVIPTGPDVSLHSPEFVEAASAQASHFSALQSLKEWLCLLFEFLLTILSEKGLVVILKHSMGRFETLVPL